MPTSTRQRRTRATPSLTLSLLLHGGLAAGALASITPAARDTRAQNVEWSIELEPLEPSALAATPPEPEALAPAPLTRAAAPRPSAPRREPRDPSRERAAPVHASAAPPSAPLASSVAAATPAVAPSVAAAGAATPAIAPSTANTPPASRSSNPYAAADVSERPRLLGQPTLRYPPRALRLGIDADVVLALIVEPSGGVSAAHVLRPAGNGFDEAALDAAQRLRFAPGRVRGTAVAVRVTWTCRFRASG